MIFVNVLVCLLLLLLLRSPHSDVHTMPTMLETKLYGTLEDMRGTAAYIKDTELDI